MNSARQAMQMALDALEYVVEQGGGPVCEHKTGGAVCFCKENEAINALRAALLQSTALPVGELTDGQIDALMRAARIQAILDKDYRAAKGQEMTAPENDAYNAALYFARFVESAHGITQGGKP